MSETRFQVKMNDDKSFDVIDTATGMTMKRNLKGYKATAYVEHYHQDIAAQEKYWADQDAARRLAA